MSSDRSRDRDTLASSRRRAVLRGAAALVTGGGLAGCLEGGLDVEREDGPGDGMADGSAADGATGTNDGAASADDGDGTSPNGTAGDEDLAGTAADEALAARERAVHERVNEIRTERGLPALSFHGEIAAVAREHSADMADRGYVGHETPEGERPADRLDEFFPGECRGIGENIAAVPREPGDPEAAAERVVQGWMDSPGHRENLLREAFDSHGIGAAFDERRVIVTQKFCAEAGSGTLG